MTVSREAENMHTDIALPVTEMGVQKVLDLCGKRLSFLPELTSQLIALEAIDVDENQLASLPESLGQLTNLRTLNVYDN
jgi:Leucine-rich repeat (LRR) protein